MEQLRMQLKPSSEDTMYRERLQGAAYSWLAKRYGMSVKHVRIVCRSRAIATLRNYAKGAK